MSRASDSNDVTGLAREHEPIIRTARIVLTRLIPELRVQDHFTDGPFAGEQHR